MAVKHGLGRGLESLIRDQAAASPPPPQDTGPRILQVPVARIRKSPWQPRRTFEQEALTELTNSVRERGILQPLLVRPAGDGYELIAGERRFRAASEAGLATVPVLVTEAADREALEIALVENIQRADLNILEEAEAYQTLADKFALTQEQIATKVGKARASVTNTMRILGLPRDTRELVADGRLSPGHAKLLAGLDIPEEQSLLARRTVTENLTVRALEKLIQRSKQAPRKARVSRHDIPTTHLQYLSDRLHSHFGTSVRITPCRTYANGKKGKGCIEVDFYSTAELDRLLEVIGLPEE